MAGGKCPRATATAECRGRRTVGPYTLLHGRFALSWPGACYLRIIAMMSDPAVHPPSRPLDEAGGKAPRGNDAARPDGAHATVPTGHVPASRGTQIAVRVIMAVAVVGAAVWYLRSR